MPPLAASQGVPPDQMLRNALEKAQRWWLSHGD
jgi:hypothetical protein